MPAHVSSAIAAYPELSCFEVLLVSLREEFGPLPISIVPAKKVPSSFVLTEVMEIFPSQYIHIGGDEATKDWKTCPDCQKNSKEGLKGVELQGYFIKRIEKFIISKKIKN
jgi:hexosaminidase